MAYRDRLRNGSFRGVAFYTPSSEQEGGRRGVVHEYPGSDDHTTQDIGKRLQRFTVTAQIIGDDYDQARDALIAALEKPGAGKLVHRYRGEFDALLEPGKTYRVVETRDEGRVATFTIPFIRAGADKSVSIKADSAARVKSAATAAKTASVSNFANTVTTSGPEFVRSEVVGSLQRANAVLSGLNNKVSSTISVTSNVPALITALGNSAAELVKTPEKLFDLGQAAYEIPEAIFGAVASVGAAFKSVAASFGLTGSNRAGASSTTGGSGSTSSVNIVTKQAQAESDAEKAKSTLWKTDKAARAAAAAQAQSDARNVVSMTRNVAAEADTNVGADSPDILATTPSTEAQLANQRSTNTLMREAAAIEAARAAVDMPYDSHQSAIDARDQLAAQLDGLAGETDSAEVYAALVDLRAELGRYLVQAAGELPKIVTVPVRSTIPALLLSYRIYGDASRHGEITIRNKLRHAGFVPGGENVQVLVDA